MRPWTLIVVSALVLAGCTTTTSGLMARSNDTEVQVNNRTLGRDLSLSGLNRAMVGGRLQARAELTSKASGDLYLQYRFVFFDATGKELESATDGWQQLNLAGGERRQISALALSGEAVEFEVAVRRIVDE
ncbi:MULTISPECIES: YcfL family protein [Ferrimonas]|uniref:YcfL family protein n=1 Tax=Ferrimonas TaxID=44011 RepID=UPI000417D826|nr:MULTISPECIES: DUF1425 domain-containing protein [Ferrimonas]USD35851.1 DUF1425 domain-containing protein [Ferrimonas sp. SCSIO 43195]